MVINMNLSLPLTQMEDGMNRLDTDLLMHTKPLYTHWNMVMILFLVPVQ